MTCEQHAVTQGSGQWEDVVAPFDCSYYTITAPAGTLFDKCSDSSDPTTEISGLSQHAVLAPPIGRIGQRWASGETITYVRSSSPLNLYFLK